jgi:hypothetical protein
MNSPASPLGGAASISPIVSGLKDGAVYGWKVRTLSRSPWFRYGAWISPQPNARGQWDVRTSPVTTATPLAVAPASVDLGRAWPNPSSDGVNLSFAVPQATSARLQVKDLQGRRIRTLLSGTIPAGRYSARWNGSDESGRRCAPGMYFIELEAGAERRTGRVVLAR